ncbi:MAG: Hsp20/alpha crystallin family protein [Chitinophagaceae bacterium]|nr:Hsp20/alpha crystallin family protein [Chitinophagaceae bacterium]
MTHVKVKNLPTVPGFFNLMDKFFTDDFQTSFKGSQPAVNIHEDEKSYTLEVIAPGVQKSDFNLAIEKNMLTISYEKKEENTEKTSRYIRHEYSLNSFKRSFHLNENLDAEKITARYEDGVLHVTIPKVEEKQKDTKVIAVN